MKVGILTFPHSPSIGAMLQMGALYHIVENMGHNVEIINYVSDKVNHRQVPPVTLKSILIKVLSMCFIKSPEQSYKEFESKMKMFPETIISKTHDLIKVSEHFDRIIVGSDQVWNPIVTGHDLNFYLKFCDDSQKKASYAASFGYMHADPEYKMEIAELLKSFTYLSVREKDGQEIVKNLTGREAKLVLDPTLAVSADYLRNVMAPYYQKRKYVLYFCIKPSPRLYDIARKYAEKYGYELVTIGGRMKDRFDLRKHAVYGTGPKEFLGLIDSAQCVFTNSFHGMAISIALHRDFYVELSSDTNSRLTSLTELLNLRDRIVGEKIPEQKRIEYKYVDRILEKERKLSIDFLQTVLE